MKQLDIYGNEIPLEETETKPLDHQGGRTTLKTWFRNCHGFRQGLYCKNCKFFLIQMRKGQVYHKCIKMSTSPCRETDIRKNDIACSLYEDKRGNDYDKNSK